MTRSMAKQSRLTGLVVALSLLGSACGGGGGGGSSASSTANSPADPPVTTQYLTPVTPAATYSNVLADCALVETNSNSCSLLSLPLLGMDTMAPDVNDILSRTVVSHPWMGERFGELLEVLPPDTLQLFRGITTVVIAFDIRPSYYHSLTGAIYLDPRYLWQTNAEKITIDRAEDYRSDFANELQFVPLWRYIKDGDYAWDYFPLEGSQTRTLNDTVLPMASLLFHELAHANDVFPPAELANINRDQSVVSASFALQPMSVSAQLAASQPLRSELLKGLARVQYYGETASSTQKMTSAETVGLDFEIDGASDDYAYSSNFEDLAMLFEEVMMKYYYDVDRELAFTDAPTGDDSFCSSYIIRWGVRNRVGLPMVASRATYALQALLDLNDVDPYIQSVPDAMLMDNMEDWCSIQDLGVSGTSAKFDRASEARERTLMRPDTMGRDYR